MASNYQVTSHYDAHIFNCQSKSCAAALKNLVAALSSKCDVVSKYKPFGLKVEWFKSYMKSSSYTIIHICEMVKEIVDILDEDMKTKVMCVDLTSETSPELAAYFKDFVTTDVSTQEDLESFVEDFVEYLHETECTPAPPVKKENTLLRLSTFSTLTSQRGKETTPQLQKSTSFKETNLYMKPVSKDLCATLATLQQKKVETDAPGNWPYEKMTNIFGEAVEDHSAYIAADVFNGSAVDIDLSEIRKYIQLKTVVDNASTAETKHFVMHKVLPALFSQGCIEGLASVADCQHPMLREQALTFIELYCLMGRATSDAASLRRAQNMLIQSAAQHSEISRDEVWPLLNKMCNALMLLQTCLYMICRRNGVNFFSAGAKCVPELVSLPRNPPGRLSDIHKILLAYTRKAEEPIVATFLACVCDGTSYPPIWDFEPHTQCILLVEVLKQVFTTMDPHLVNLNFLKEYTKSRSFKNVFTKRPSKKLLEMTLRGVSFFFQYCLEKNSDVKNHCNVAAAIYDSLWNDKCDVDPYIHALMYEQVPVLRQSVLNLYTKRSLLTEGNVQHYYIREIKRLLSPSLEINVSNVATKKNWMKYLGKFLNHPVCLNVLWPTLRDHFDVNKSTEESSEDLRYFNEMKQLQQLRHPNIIRLMAFHSSQMPQFYVLEDYGKNLQAELKHRRENNTCFDSTTLLRLLLQAAEALSYCHSQGVIHRNLTAASLKVISSNQKLLLGSFEVAHKLKGSQTVVINDHLDFLPLRWTAPESMRQSCFSLESDVWMLGHMIFEVMTHGILPYSDKIDDDKLILDFYPQLSLGKPPRLNPDPCLSSGVYDIIDSCTHFQARERISVTQVVERLNLQLSISAVEQNVESPLYTDAEMYSSEITYHSEEFQRGLRRIEGGNLQLKYNEMWDMQQAAEVTLYENVSSHAEVSSGVKIFKLTDRLVFRVVNKRKLSYQFVRDIIDGATEPILPPVFISITKDKWCIDKSMTCFDVHLLRRGSMGTLTEVCTSRKLGPQLVTYMELLHNWAVDLRALHNKTYGLGHFSASSLWVHKSTGKYTIHPIDLGFMWSAAKPDQESDQESSSQNPANIINTCAPELVMEGKASFASDVFSVGIVGWQILVAFFQLKQPQDKNVRVKDIIMKCDFAARCPECPGNLGNLLRSCVATKASFRPKWPQIIQTFKSAVKEMKGIGPNLTSADASVKEMEIANPSSQDELSSVSTEDSLNKPRSKFGLFEVSNPSSVELPGSSNTRFPPIANESSDSSAAPTPRGSLKRRDPCQIFSVVLDPKDVHLSLLKQQKWKSSNPELKSSGFLVSGKVKGLKKRFNKNWSPPEATLFEESNVKNPNANSQTKLLKQPLRKTLKDRSTSLLYKKALSYISDSETGLSDAENFQKDVSKLISLAPASDYNKDTAYQSASGSSHNDDRKAHSDDELGEVGAASLVGMPELSRSLSSLAEFDLDTSPLHSSTSPKVLAEESHKDAEVAKCVGYEMPSMDDIKFCKHEYLALNDHCELDTAEILKNAVQKIYRDPCSDMSEEELFKNAVQDISLTSSFSDPCDDISEHKFDIYSPVKKTRPPTFLYETENVLDGNLCDRPPIPPRSPPLQLKEKDDYTMALSWADTSEDLYEELPDLASMQPPKEECISFERKTLSAPRKSVKVRKANDPLPSLPVNANKDEPAKTETKEDEDSEEEIIHVEETFEIENIYMSIN